jgi:hypothetical protein
LFPGRLVSFVSIRFTPAAHRITAAAQRCDADVAPTPFFARRGTCSSVEAGSVPCRPGLDAQDRVRGGSIASNYRTRRSLHSIALVHILSGNNAIAAQVSFCVRAWTVGIPAQGLESATGQGALRPLKQAETGLNRLASNERSRLM